MTLVHQIDERTESRSVRLRRTSEAIAGQPPGRSRTTDSKVAAYPAPEVRRPRLTYANVTATPALFIALGGVSYAGVQLSRDSVTSRHIADKAVKRSDLDLRAVGLRNLDQQVRERLGVAEGTPLLHFTRAYTPNPPSRCRGPAATRQRLDGGAPSRRIRRALKGDAPATSL